VGLHVTELAKVHHNRPGGEWVDKTSYIFCTINLLAVNPRIYIGRYALINAHIRDDERVNGVVLKVVR
jgi:hypothetical protein